MNFQPFSITDISKVAEWIATVSERISKREKWQELARKGLRLNQNVTLRQVALFNRSYTNSRKRSLTTALEKWKKHMKWRQISRNILHKCRVFIFNQLAVMLAKQKTKAKRNQWIRITNKIIANQRNEEIAESFAELVDIRSAKSIMEEWHIYKVAARMIRQQQWQEITPKYVKKVTHDKLVEGQRQLRIIGNWESVTKDAVINKIHEIFKHEQLIEELRGKWKEIVQQKKVERIEHFLAMSNKWNELTHGVKTGELQKALDELNGIRNKWKEVQEGLMKKEQERMLQKGLNMLDMVHKWESLSKRNVARLRKVVLKAGREYLNQSRERQLTKITAKQMIVKWAVYSHSRNYIRNLYNETTDEYSVSIQHNSAAMIQALFRGFMERKKQKEMRFAQQRAFNIWRAMILVRRKAHTKFPKCIKEVQVPRIAIGIPKISNIIKLDEPLNRLGPIREMLDLKEALRRAKEEKEQKVEVQEEEEENAEEEFLPESTESIPETEDVAVQPETSGIRPTLIESINKVLDQKEEKPPQDDVFSDESSVFSEDEEDTIKGEPIPTENIFSDEYEEEEENNEWRFGTIAPVRTVQRNQGSEYLEIIENSILSLSRDSRFESANEALVRLGGIFVSCNAHNPSFCEDFVKTIVTESMKKPN